MTPNSELLPMPTYNPENERIKHRYFAYLREAQRRGEPSVDAAAKALGRFETHTRFKSFLASLADSAQIVVGAFSIPRNA